MFYNGRNTRTVTRTEDNVKDSKHSIIFAIVTSNFNEVKKLINSTNYNDVLDDDTGFTSLQYAIASPNVSN